MTNAWLRPHRRWLALLGCGLFLLLAVPPLAKMGLEVEQRRAEDIAAERARVRESAERFQEDMALAQRPEAPISASDIDLLLMPVDRLRVVAGLERQAASARFSHFTYTLAPERKAGDAGMDDALATSDLTLAADMPLDTDAFDFLKNARRALPGRVRLRQLTLTRLAADAPLSLGNVHMEAVLDWLSNGTAKDKAEVR